MAKHPSQQISTDSRSIKDLFKTGYFSVPINQREYSWEEDNLDKLWDDLVFTLNHSNGQSIGHFLGAIVIIGGSSSHENDRWSVIDGQQRLITLTILTETLLSYVSTIVQDRRVKEWLESSLKSCFFEIGRGGVITPRVILNKDDDFYRTSLLDCPTFADKESFWDSKSSNNTKARERIKNAFVFFNKKINDYLNEDQSNKEERIKNLSAVLFDDFYLLDIRTEELWMAYRLFETLNERGLALSQADLIKNVLLQSAKESGSHIEEIVSKKWVQLVENYEEQSDERLELPQIIQFSYTHRDSLVKKDDIFDRVSKSLRSALYDPNELACFFEEDSRNWRDFLLGDLRKWSQCLADSQSAILQPLWKTHCVPYVMAVMNRFGDDIESLQESLRLCEHYLFRQGLICNDPVRSLQDFFAKAALKVRVGDDLDKLTTFFRDNSSTDVFVNKFSNASVKNMKQAFYILWKIENHLSSSVDFRPSTERPLNHVEHILPKKPDASWNSIQDSEMFNYHINRIGNLLVLEADINKHIRNGAFEQKLSNKISKDYESSNLKLPEEIIVKKSVWLENGEWTFDSINKRQTYLAEHYAAVVWNI